MSRFRPDQSEAWVSRDECPSCNAQRDQLGRLPIGFCGPECLARLARDALHAGCAQDELPSWLPLR